MRILLFLLILPAPLHAQSKQPNVVILLSDDQGWGDLSVSGNSNIHTPNIDGIAKNGAVFERFFVQPVWRLFQPHAGT